MDRVGGGRIFRHTVAGEVNKETAAAFRKQCKKRREDVEKKRWTVVNTLTAEDRKKERVYGRDTEGKGEAI